MLIRFIPPPESEAKVEIKEDGELLITPRFPTAHSTASFGSIIIRGSKGKERRYSLSVSGSLGRVISCESKSVQPAFDEVKGD